MAGKKASASSSSKGSGFFKRYFVDAMGAMAMGLFASLIIGLIISQLAKLPGMGYNGGDSGRTDAQGGKCHV